MLFGVTTKYDITSRNDGVTVHALHIIVFEDKNYHSAKAAAVMWSLVLSVCLSVCEQDNTRTRKRTSTEPGWLGVGKGWLSRSDGPDPDPHMHSGSLFYFCHHCGTGRYRTLLKQSLADFFTKLGEVTGADKATNLQHFGNDPIDIWIRIRINPKILIRIPDHFRLTFRPWRSLRSLSALVLFTVYSVPANNIWCGPRMMHVIYGSQWCHIPHFKNLNWHYSTRVTVYVIKCNFLVDYSLCSLIFC